MAIRLEVIVSKETKNPANAERPNRMHPATEDAVPARLGQSDKIPVMLLLLILIEYTNPKYWIGTWNVLMYKLADTVIKTNIAANEKLLIKM